MTDRRSGVQSVRRKFDMGIPSVLFIISIVICLFVVIDNLKKIFQQRAAELYLKSKLREDRDFQGAIREIISLDICASGACLTDAKLDQIQTLLRSKLELLNEQRRRRIAEGIHQSSKKGRSNYILKILSQSIEFKLNGA